MSPSGFYDWRDRKPSRRFESDRTLLKRIWQVYKRSRETYGSPRVHIALKQMGIHVGRKRVARLMREAGLKARCTRHYRPLAGLHRFYNRVENRRLTAPKPTAVNQQWVADLTYIKVKDRWCYLATVMDLYSRKIISWSLSPRKNAALTLSTLKKAIKRRQPKPGLIYHTDRGVEYKAREVQVLLSNHGIVPSNNRAFRSIDNAEMESFFKTLKGDAIRGAAFKTMDALRGALRSYINYFYNRERLHSSLGYYSPEEYERVVHG